MTERKPKNSYHHGDLERALLDAALDTIRTDGVGGLTLRGVGARLGVSRTALYRHFDNKAALVARVAAEGFRLLRDTMARAAANASPDHSDTLPIMAAAYVHFALANPTHYQAMFGAGVKDGRRHPDVVRHADAALEEIAAAVRAEQQQGRIGPGDPMEFAQIVWALAHGVAALAASHHVPRTAMSVEELAVLGSSFLRRGLRPLRL